MIKLSQIMPRVTIVTIQNGQCKIIVFQKNQFVRYSKIVQCVTKKKVEINDSNHNTFTRK
jgi:hypothetical protein